MPDVDDTVVVQLNEKGMTYWMVKPDLGEHDVGVVSREADTSNGGKFSGWSNPLAWTDAGDDDEKVLTQQKATIRFDDSEGPTKEDNGEAEETVVWRESDTGNGKKFHGWTNPLSWTDAGDADETVL